MKTMFLRASLVQTSLAAALALGQLREKSARSVLNLALRDAENVVREAAQTALAALN